MADCQLLITRLVTYILSSMDVQFCVLWSVNQATLVTHSTKVQYYSTVFDVGLNIMQSSMQVIHLFIRIDNAPEISIIDFIIIKWTKSNILVKQLVNLCLKKISDHRKLMEGRPKEQHVPSLNTEQDSNYNSGKAGNDRP